MITCLGLSPALDVTYGVDELRPGGIHRPNWVLALPGGKALNVARAATTLSGDVRAIAPLGGFTGARVRAALDAGGIATTVIETDAETRACVSVLDDGGGATEFYEPAADLDTAAWHAICRAVDELAGGWLAVSGSVPAGREADLARLLVDASARGIHVAVDTHGPALALILDSARPALVKVNRDEATALVGPASAAALAVRLHDRGAQLAIVTDGADGAVAVSADGAWHARPGERGRFAIGSGDSFLGGLLVALDADPADVRAALALATAAASANTLERGAAVFAAADAERLRGSVHVGSAPVGSAPLRTTPVGSTPVGEVDGAS